MIILAIDTSCDETSVAVTSGTKVLSNVISSQVRYHKKFGGVVPFLAQRLHKERIDAVIQLALQRAALSPVDLDAVAVTVGPGLAPALEVGIQKAKELAKTGQKPLYPVNHMVGHIASCYAQIGSKKPSFAHPYLALLVSGGHTELVYSPKFGHFQILGQTLDDALGEAYDKLAKMLGLGYPGGKLVSQLAEKGNPEAYSLPVPMQHSPDLNFSYSGLKNAARLLIHELKENTHAHVMTKEEIQDVCAVFQRVAQEAVLIKVEKALKQYPEVRGLLFAGGVAANAQLRRKLRFLCKKYAVQLTVPANLALCTDNAAMIGIAAFLGAQNGQKPVRAVNIDRKPGLTVEEAF